MIDHISKTAEEYKKSIGLKCKKTSKKVKVIKTQKKLSNKSLDEPRKVVKKVFVERTVEKIEQCGTNKKVEKNEPRGTKKGYKNIIKMS